MARSTKQLLDSIGREFPGDRHLEDSLRLIQENYPDVSRLRKGELPLEDGVASALLWGVEFGMALRAEDGE